MAGHADFVDALLNPERATPPGLNNPNGERARKRFDVYRNNVTVSLTEALETAFPAVRKLLGVSNFGVLSLSYVRRYRPESPLLMFYGARMPEFLETFEPAREIAYLPDVAKLELALRESYHAADSVPLAPTALRIPTDRLMASRITFAPSVRLVRSIWPIHGIWRFNMESGAPKPRAGGENVLVTRPAFDPRLSTLAPGGGTFVAELLAGASFGEAMDAALSRVPEFDLGEILGVFLEGAAITGIDEVT
ncbi:MAG: DNA-binding domain-containing protein [Rhodobacter sp.]|nr:DNA-binding domain-containing protein [Rhodobacter sp.]MCY4169845.1 DNA-binding domain-containing protein [Rhodobacter sp.]